MPSILPSFLSSLFWDEEARAGIEPITRKTTARGSVSESGIGSFAFSGMQGWRVTMEDAHMVCTSIAVEGSGHLPKGNAIFGVMDGHGGDFTSDYAANNFLQIYARTASLKKYAALSTENQKNVPGVELLRHALTETFATLDVEIRKLQNKRNDTVMAMTEQLQRSDGTTRVRYERSGSTCVVVMMTPSHIICANAGDSRAILKRGSKVLPLSFDHKPNNIPELERVNNAGGFVKSKRVDGDLAVSRGLGDFSYKSNESRTVEQQKVVPDPEFVVYPRDPKQDEFVVLACDGVWDVCSNKDCADFVDGMLEAGESDLGLICEEAIDTCLERNSRDNMTIAMVAFDQAKLATGLRTRSVVYQRRAARQAKHFEASAKQVASNLGFGFGTTQGTPVAVCSKK